jgi:hypothetical protein
MVALVTKTSPGVEVGAVDVVWFVAPPAAVAVVFVVWEGVVPESGGFGFGGRSLWSVMRVCKVAENGEM